MCKSDIFNQICQLVARETEVDSSEIIVEKIQETMYNH